MASESAQTRRSRADGSKGARNMTAALRTEANANAPVKKRDGAAPRATHRRSGPFPSRSTRTTSSTTTRTTRRAARSRTSC